MKAFLKAVKKIIVNRLFILSCIVLLLFSILFHRIFELQIVQGEKLEKDFSLSILKERKIEGVRGNIYDRYGYPLAENVIAYDILLDGSIRVDNINQMIFELCELIKKSGDEIVKGLPITINQDGTYVFTESDAQVIRFKKNVFHGGASKNLDEKQENMNAYDMFEYLRDTLFKIPKETYSDEEILTILNIRYPLWLNRYTQYQLETIAIDINSETLARIEENIWKFPGVSIVEDPLRVYNDAKYFAHIIGYTGKIDSATYDQLKDQGYEADDTIGKIGIEKEMEQYLRGEDGIETVEVDNLGRTMQVIDTKEPSSGEDIYLTIDRDLQIEAYQILEKNLAYLLSNNLSYSGYSGYDKDDGVTLMRDVFESAFRNELFSIDKIAAAQDGERQKNLYYTFKNAHNNLVQTLMDELEDAPSIPNNEELGYYRYFLTKLHEEGFLSNNYKDLELYTTFTSKEATFQELLNKYIEEGMLTTIDSKDQDIYGFVKELILNEYTNYYTFHKDLYGNLAKNERFSYTDLCVALVEQEIVNSSEDQLRNLKVGRLGALAFMKEKISTLEITPQQLALDPYSGSVVLTDIYTGEIIVMVSYPSYDNNKFVNNFDYDYYLKLYNHESTPLFPMATQGKVAPGSTFKMVTAMAALEEEVIRPKEYYSCLGLYQKVVPPARCWIYGYGGSHGALTISSALEVSCNYFYYDMGYRLSINEDGSYMDAKGVNTLNEYAKKLGLGTSTGIEIGDSLPTLAVQDAVRSSIGQTSNTFTPVQLARYVSALANGGIAYELQLVDKVQKKNGNLVFDKMPTVTWENNFNEINIKTIQEGMNLVVNGSKGTARGIFAGFPIQVAGKTGTGQQALNRPDHGTFVAFAPYEKPEVGISVVIPFGYGSTVPTIVGRDVLAAYYQIGNENLGQISSFDHLLD